MNFKNGVKKLQAAAYNGARTVHLSTYLVDFIDVILFLLSLYIKIRLHTREITISQGDIQ